MVAPLVLSDLHAALPELGRLQRPRYQAARLAPIEPALAGLHRQIADRVEEAGHSMFGVPDPWIERHAELLRVRRRQIVDRYACFAALVPQANAFFDHLARLDALQRALGADEIAPFVAGLLARVGELAPAAAVAKDRAPVGAAARTLARAAEALGARLIRAATRDVPAVRDAVVAGVALLSTPLAFVDLDAGGDADAGVAEAAAARLVTALDAADGALASRSDDRDAATRREALGQSAEAAAAYVDAADSLQRAIAARRRDALAAGVTGVAVAQVRECLALGGAICDTTGEPVALAAWLTRLAVERSAAPPPGVAVARLAVPDDEKACHRRLLDAVSSYHAAVAAVAGALGAIEIAAEPLLGPY